MSSNQTALVTGAAMGIGRAAALRLAADGFDVALNDIETNQTLLDTLRLEIEAQGRRSVVVVADVSKPDEVENMIRQTVETLGELNVMVANAGITKLKSFLDTTVDEWDNLLSINARGVFLCYQYAAKQMIAQGKGGRLIGACSGSGHKGEPMLAAYAASKFAVRGLTQAVAIELGKHQITVNCYSPAGIDTPMSSVQGLARDAGGWDLVKKAEESVTPLGRFGQVADVVNVISFLASEASNWITGQAIMVDGGRGLCGTPYHG